MPTPPLCPVTGRPAIRLVQWVSADLLAGMWRVAARVDARPSFRGTERFGLWLSPTGLHFFDPMTAGDAAFYRALYARLKPDRFPNACKPRGEFAIAAAEVRKGDRVLDVGCGFGPFRHAAPWADYVGIDPHFSGPSDVPTRVETLEAHLETQAGTYDVVTAFQVIEHVEDPVGLLAGMTRAARPGGTVVVSAPHVPSAHTRIPNYLVNATPHHLTWWTRDALLAAAERCGLTNARVEVAPWAEVDGVVAWMDRLSPVTCRDRRFRHDWRWHASVIFAFAAASICWRVKPLPTLPADDEGASLVLIGRRPD